MGINTIKLICALSYYLCSMGLFEQKNESGNLRRHINNNNYICAIDMREISGND